MTIADNAKSEGDSNSDLSNNSRTKCDENVLLTRADEGGTPEPIIVNVLKENGIEGLIDASMQKRKDPESLDKQNTPPDGGIRAWTVVLSSFIINGILFSIINTYTFIYQELSEEMKSQGDENSSTKACELFN